PEAVFAHHGVQRHRDDEGDDADDSDGQQQPTRTQIPQHAVPFPNQRKGCAPSCHPHQRREGYGSILILCLLECSALERSPPYRPDSPPMPAATLVPPLFVLLWATGFIGARYAMPWAEPFGFLAARFAIAFAIL